MAVAAVRGKPTKETASQFRYFMFNYMHVGSRLSSAHCASKTTKWDDHFANTPHHYTSFKPVSLCGEFVEKGTQLLENTRSSGNSSKDFDRNWSQKVRCNSGDGSGYGDPPEVWEPPGDGVAKLRVTDGGVILKVGSRGGLAQRMGLGVDRIWGVAFQRQRTFVRHLISLSLDNRELRRCSLLLFTITTRGSIYSLLKNGATQIQAMKKQKPWMRRKLNLRKVIFF